MGVVEREVAEDMIILREHIAQAKTRLGQRGKGKAVPTQPSTTLPGPKSDQTTMRDAILRWFATGEVGISSRTLACALAGIPEASAFTNHPHDPDDFRRCLLMLDAVPGSRERLQDAELLHVLRPGWQSLIAAWDELEALLISEVGDVRHCRGKSAPLTYKRMKELGL